MLKGKTFQVQEKLSGTIVYDIERFSSLSTLLRTTARTILLKTRRSLEALPQTLNMQEVEDAWVFTWTVRSTLKKTSLYKIYAAIFTCLFSRAVHLDIVMDYSTKEFLQTVGRFVPLRGFPEVILSDSGTHVVGANKALQGRFKMMNEDSLITEINFIDCHGNFHPVVIHGDKLPLNR